MKKNNMVDLVIDMEKDGIVKSIRFSSKIRDSFITDMIKRFEDAGYKEVDRYTVDHDWTNIEQGIEKLREYSK